MQPLVLQNHADPAPCPDPPWNLQALCAAPGDQLGFEHEFANPGTDTAWFEMHVGGLAGNPGSTCNAAAAAFISLVTDEAQWHDLAPLASLADLAAQRSGSRQPLRAVSGQRFQLGAHERCLLRFKLSRGLQLQEAASSGGAPSWSWGEVAVRPLAGSAALGQAAAPAATLRVGVQLLAGQAVDRTLRLYCPAAEQGAAAATVQHAVQLDCLPGAAGLLAAGPSLTFSSKSPGVTAEVQAQQRRVVLSCPAPGAGSTRRFLLAACRHGATGGSSSAATGPGPLEVWEVFLHGLPAVRLAAGVGTTATASRALPPLEGDSGHLRFHWRGCGARELHAGSSSGPSGGHRLVLSYEPATAARRELLLSAVAPGAAGGRGTQAELLLVALDASSTRVSRTFKAEAAAGCTVSKKAQFRSPYASPRFFAVRSLHPALRVAAAAVAGFELAVGESAPVRLTFDAAAAAGAGVGGSRDDEGRTVFELTAVVESWPAVGGGSGGGGARQVEEVFRVLLTVV